MIETGVLINRYAMPMFWHQPPGSTGSFLPDTNNQIKDPQKRYEESLWNCIWQNRDKDLAGFAHTHPGGITHASLEDLTTFVAIERGLGKRLDWWIVTRDDVTLYRHVDKVFSDIDGEALEYIVSPHQRMNNVTRDCYLMCPINDTSGWRYQEWLPKLRSLSYQLFAVPEKLA